MEGNPWYLFVKADIHDSRIWAKGPTNRLEKCIKGICYNNIKLTGAPHIYGSDVDGVKTLETRLQASSDSKICWLTRFRRQKADFSPSTPVSTQSRAKRTDITQSIVVYHTHVEFEGIAGQDYCPGDKNMGKRGPKVAKTAKTRVRTNIDQSGSNLARGSEM